MNVTFPAPTENIEHQPDHLLIRSVGIEARIWIYTPTVIRVNLSKNFQADDNSFAVIKSPQAGFEVKQGDKEITVDTGQVQLRISTTSLRFNFYTPDGKLLSGDDERFGTVWQNERFTNYRKMFEDERFIGLGEKTGDLDRRGCNYVNWNTDASNYRIDTDPLYKTLPFFIGLHDNLMYGYFLDNTHRSFFDFGASTDHDMYWLGADGGDLNYYFFGAQSVPDLISDYTWLTGRMEMPPLWSLGYQQCRWSYMSAKELLDVAKKFRELKIPADVLYCDIDYMKGFKIFTWNEETFPDPQSLLSELGKMGFKLVTIVDPGIKIEKGYAQYDEGIEKGYFATYPNGDLYTGEVWPGRCHFPDFFNADVRNWWGASFKTLTEPGVAGFWNDMNEPAAWGQHIPEIVKFGDKYMPEVRNAYGMQMARATYDGTKKLLNGQRPFVLTRAAYSGVQRYSAVWTGDNTATDEQLLLGCRLVNSLGLAGVSFTGVDISGFSGDPTPELMVRWNSIGVFTPMFRNHSMKGTVRREPWKWGRQNEKIIKKDIELRYRLLPYIYSAFYQSHQTGLPVCRTLAIDYPFTKEVYDKQFHNQFMFGDSLLVAPATSTDIKIKVYLPPGDWYRFSTGEKFKGGKAIIAEAPLTDLPVFVKAGAIIPMQTMIQNTAEAGNGILELHIWPGKKETSFIYYEDDGTTYGYEQGAFYKRNITYEPRNNELHFSEVEGAYISRFSEIKVINRGSIKVREVVCDNRPDKFECTFSTMMNITFKSS